MPQAVVLRDSNFTRHRFCTPPSIYFFSSLLGEEMTYGSRWSQEAQREKTTKTRTISSNSLVPLISAHQSQRQIDIQRLLNGSRFSTMGKSIYWGAPSLNIILSRGDFACQHPTLRSIPGVRA